MKIRMTESTRGSLNGVTVDDLEAGQDYETAPTAMGQRMGRALVDRYLAIELDDAGNPVVPDEPAPAEVATANPPAKPRKK